MERNKRFREYISYYYRFLYIFRLRPEAEHYFILFSFVFLFAIALVILLLEQGEHSLTSFTQFFLQAIFTAGLGLVIFVTILWLRVSVDDELIRSNRIGFTDIQEKDVFPINRNATEVSIAHDPSSRAQLHAAIPILLNSMEIETESYYRIHAGSLDIPKVALREINFKDNVIQTRICSFRDTFFTHYFADFPLSRVSSGENPVEGNTLRNLLGPLVQRHYAEQVDGDGLQAFQGLPNPLGITSAVRVVSSDESGDNWILQKRGRSVAANRRCFQMGFAGLIDALPFFVSENYSLYDLVHVELHDEVLSKLFEIGVEKEDVDQTCHVFCLCINHNYMYQPEIIAMTTLSIGQASFRIMRESLGQYTTGELQRDIAKFSENSIVLVTDREWLTPEGGSALGFREVDKLCAQHVLAKLSN